MNQLHSEILKLNLLSSESTKKKLMAKITWNKRNQTFFLEKFKTKVIKFLVLCCQEVEKFNMLLACLLTYTHPTIYPKCIGSGIQNTGKLNKLLSVMNVCRHGFQNGVMATCYNLFKCFHRIFVAWVVFVKSIFSCLNLKPCNGFYLTTCLTFLIKLDMTSQTL